MATHSTCDFCGEEMKPKEKAATLKIREHRNGSDDDEYRNPFSMFGSSGDSGAVKLEMCASCLGHLLPITERVRRERLAVAAQKPKANTVAEKELNEIMSTILGMPLRYRGGTDGA